MNLPAVISDLVKAQEKFDNIAYANTFSETAIVYDEGRTHRGKTEIAKWIEGANKKYQTVMMPVSYEENGTASILTAHTSGNFPGSPITLQYHFQIENGLIQSLKITG